MSFRNPVLLGVLCVLCGSSPQDSPRRLDARPGELLVVRPPVATRDDQRSAVVEFLHENGIDRIVPALDPEDVSIVQVGPRLFIKSLAPRSGTVDVIGASGELYRLLLEPAQEGADTLVQIARADLDAADAPGPVEFARALRLGIRPDGAVVLDGSDEILARVDGVEFLLHRVVEWRSFRGIVLHCRNTEGRPRRVDERRIRAEGLVAAGASNHEIPAGGTARLILIFWR